MTTMIEDAGVLGKEFVNNGMKSFTSLLQVRAGDRHRDERLHQEIPIKSGAAAFEKLFSAKSIETAIDIQTDYAKKAYEDFVASQSELGNLYAEMAKEPYKPFGESLVAKAK